METAEKVPDRRGRVRLRQNRKGETEEEVGHRER